MIVTKTYCCTTVRLFNMEKIHLYVSRNYMLLRLKLQSGCRCKCRGQTDVRHTDLRAFTVRRPFRQCQKYKLGFFLKANNLCATLQWPTPTTSFLIVCEKMSQSLYNAIFPECHLKIEEKHSIVLDITLAVDYMFNKGFIFTRTFPNGMCWLLRRLKRCHDSSPTSKPQE